MLPLAGRRILVTRAMDQAGKLSDTLRALGAEPVEVPVIEIGPPKSFAALDAAIRRLVQYDWLVFTSANAVKAFVLRALALHVPLTGMRAKIAAVGAATAEVIAKAGFTVSYVPEKYVAESLVAGFPEDVKDKRFLLARATVARDVIPDALREAGARIDVADAYENVLPVKAPEVLQRAMKGRIDAATFTSSSSVTHLAEAARKGTCRFPLPGVLAVSIGPVTSKTLREHGWEPAAEADPHDIPGLVAAVSRVLG
jgi:uroporphyrinogen-III synthase/uroporphyrinogen III methyltransferase/synthase